MMSLQNPLALIGRILLALMFVVSGYGKIADVGGTAGYIASVGMPMPQVMAILAIVVELGSAIALIIGFKARWAAFALAVFTLVATMYFHKYWAMPAAEQMMQQLMFLKNLAVTGGLLLVVAYGPGAWSVDKR
jgi:putative oxidoreductase